LIGIETEQGTGQLNSYGGLVGISNIGKKQAKIFFRLLSGALVPFSYAKQG
jgi:hypothetical protein